VTARSEIGKVWWEIWHQFYWKFLAETKGEKIWKSDNIWQLWTKNIVCLFWLTLYRLYTEQNLQQQCIKTSISPQHTVSYGQFAHTSLYWPVSLSMSLCTCWQFITVSWYWEVKSQATKQQTVGMGICAPGKLYRYFRKFHSLLFGHEMQTMHGIQQYMRTKSRVS